MTHSPSTLAAQRGEPSYVWRAGQARRLEMIEHWALLHDARVLVAGCGVGTYAARFRQNYTPHVEAFDIEADRVRQAQVETPHALVAAAEALPYPDNSFDTILSHEVLEHVADDTM
ncbi:MAG: class I SAM-dependent methyltransferase, partial [Anaerolineae bacterium]|nr:class I SAM-dependent methyltransferase [Anaerolineae bacterium]